MNFKSADIKQFTMEELRFVFEKNHRFICQNLNVEDQQEVAKVMLHIEEACKEFKTDNVIIGINTILVIKSLAMKEREQLEESTKH